MENDWGLKKLLILEKPPSVKFLKYSKIQINWTPYLIDCVCLYVCLCVFWERQFKNAQFIKFQTVVENQSFEHCSSEEGVLWRLGESRGLTAGKGERCKTIILRTDIDDKGTSQQGSKIICHALELDIRELQKITMFQGLFWVWTDLVLFPALSPYMWKSQKSPPHFHGEGREVLRGWMA